jgi:serine/threonine protein kinase
MKRQTICGTLDYMSPEIVSNMAYDQCTDLWCVGILTFELLTGKAPFEAKNQKVTEERIKRGNIIFPSYVSSVAKDFIKSFLQKNPNHRMKLEQAEQHEFIISNCS